MERSFTDFLCPDSTFAIGAGSVFNLVGQNFFYNRSGSPVAADARAIHQDFVMVGQDIQDVAESVKKQNERQLSLGL